MHKDPSLQQLRTFLRVVERGSLSAAAKDLGATQPTVSRQLRELEIAYGSALIVRTTRSLHLTDSGKIIYEYARSIVQSDDLLRERLTESKGKVAGRIHVAAPSGFGAFVVAPFCGRFIERHPDAQIDLHLSDARSDLVGERIDVAVRIGRLADSSMFAKPLATLDEVLVGHPRCISDEVQHPKDLVNLPWIAFSGLQDGDAVSFERQSEKVKIEFSPRLRIDQIVGHREALLAGAGIGLIHQYAVDSDIKAGRLIRLLPEWCLPKWPVHALFPVKEQPYRLQRWCEELKQELNGLPGLESR